MLFDPMVQNDDVRCHHVYFHQYLHDAPANVNLLEEEFKAISTPAARLTGMVLVPLLGIPWTSKVIQNACFIILLLAAFTMLTAPRGGLAFTVLVLFLFLRLEGNFLMMVGGTPRSFAFPALFLWLSGATAGQSWAKITAIFVAAAFYPQVLVLLLAAEGFFVLRGGALFKWQLLGKRLLRYTILVGAVSVILLPFYLSLQSQGRALNLQDIRNDPVYLSGGRIGALPLSEISSGALARLTRLTGPESNARAAEWLDPMVRGAGILTIIPWFVLVLLCFCRLTRIPVGIWAMGLAAVFWAVTASLFLVRFYLPGRYLEFGIVSCGVWALAAAAGRPACAKFTCHGAVIRNFACLLLCIGIWGCWGAAEKPSRGMTISGSYDAQLYSFVRTLPPDSVIAGHPLDCDDIPYWGERSVVFNIEASLSFRERQWRQQSERCIALFSALYAREEQDLLSFCDEHAVTHLLIRKGRYADDVKARSISMEPFTEWAAAAVGELSDPRDLAINRVSRESLIYEDSRWGVIDVTRLRSDWEGR
jgi:hypothetical protein